MSLDERPGDDFIPDSEFRYLGFSEGQISLLQGQSDDLRLIVYREGLRMLMESGPGYEITPGGELNLL